MDVGKTRNENRKSYKQTQSRHHNYLHKQLMLVSEIKHSQKTESEDEGTK